MQLNYPRRISLGQFPTPLEKLERLSRHLGGPEIYVKRDDQTGLATGGNKTRKLEFVLAEAQSQGCDHLITVGGPQSNHCRQTAAAAAKLGLACSVVLLGTQSDHIVGNLLLDQLLGAQIYWSGDGARDIVAEDLKIRLRSEGHIPYMVPMGASTPLGAVGYVAALQETLEQMEAQALSIDAIVLASSSAGTQAGLVAGAALFGYSGAIVGISIDATADDLRARVGQIAKGALELLTRPGLALADVPMRVEVNPDYLGGGYSVVGDLERDAIRTVARMEGLLLDPVYTGRAMGGLIDLVQKKTFRANQRILFWHTGGIAAMSAFTSELTTLF